jgi:orotate phosphoribosyltransferase
MSKYVQLAKRENNNKRGFLIVNPYLGKHVAAKPSEIMNMFDETAKLIPEDLVPERTLVIGFAETATALGIRYAVNNKTSFIQTTRENVASESGYIYFSEEHSHATAQYICKEYVDSVINEIDRIIFIDDEITTGNTVLNAIKAINAAYKKEFKYEVVSVLNSMNDKQLADYKEKNIGVYYLDKIDNSDYETIAKSLSDNGVYHEINTESEYDESIYSVKYEIDDTRTMTEGVAYQADCEAVAKNIIEQFSFDKDERILVLGTEEFMYAGLNFAFELEQMGMDVRFHATTRSPIGVSKDSSYPLCERYQLRSVYDKNRTTFVYDLKTYDRVFIVTEHAYLDKCGLNTIVKALEKKGKAIRAISI